jgi:hypothetical protein
MMNPLDDLKKQFGDSGHLTDVPAPSSVYLSPDDVTADHRREIVFKRRVVHGTISNQMVATAGERIPGGSLIYIHPVTGLAYVCKPTPPPMVIPGAANTPKLDGDE